MLEVAKTQIKYIIIKKETLSWFLLKLFFFYSNNQILCKCQSDRDKTEKKTLFSLNKCCCLTSLFPHLLDFICSLIFILMPSLAIIWMWQGRIHHDSAKTLYKTAHLYASLVVEERVWFYRKWQHWFAVLTAWHYG